ncbi:MAG TPA: hypothetical protein VJ846_07955 [Sphingomicrobium sp.]|nr:hypothetical protein [Sphingomicrobium sp.]
MKKSILVLAALATAGAAVPAAAQNIHQRQVRQEQRIRQGERTGQLTPAEARHLQLTEMRLHRTEARLRWRGGGHLTWQERRRLQAMERRDSAEIYRLKHNYRRY